MDDLGHGHEVHVAVVLEDFVDPEEESVEEFGVVLEPGGVVVEAEWSAVLIVVTLKVVVEKSVKLIAWNLMTIRLRIK